MASMKDLMILITLFLSLSVLSTSEAKSSSNKLVQKTCKKTGEFYKLCKEILESYPEAVSAESAYDLAEVVLQNAVVDTQIATDKMRALLKRKVEQFPGVSKTMEACVDWYDKTAQQLDSLSMELENTDDASYDTSFADPNKSAECEKAIASAGVKLPEIEPMIKRLKCFCKIVVAVTDGLQHES